MLPTARRALREIQMPPTWKIGLIFWSGDLRWKSYAVARGSRRPEVSLLSTVSPAALAAYMTPCRRGRANGSRNRGNTDRLRESRSGRASRTRGLPTSAWSSRGVDSGFDGGGASSALDANRDTAVESDSPRRRSDWANKPLEVRVRDSAGPDSAAPATNEGLPRRRPGRHPPPRPRPHRQAGLQFRISASHGRCGYHSALQTSASRVPAGNSISVSSTATR